MKKALIVGSGLGGLALSVRLAKAGYEVSVFEKNDFPGGKASELKDKGYRFDAGPSLFTLPELVDELFTLCGENPKEKFSYTRLGHICRYFFANGKRADSNADWQVFAKNLEENLGEPAENVIRYLNESKRKWELTSDLFIFSDFANLKSFLSSKFFKGVLSVAELNVFKTMNEYNESRLKTPEAVQLFNRYATYNGSNPFKVPATLTVVPYVEYGLGAFMPDKGIVDITNSIYELAQRQGVKFHFNEKVEEILHTNGKITGIRTEKGTYASALVVSNADAVPTYKYLLRDEARFEKLAAVERSTSALVFNWGIKHEFKELGLHNIFFSADYQKEFKALFETKTMADDPTIYVFISSKHIPSDAPPGCENWFTMINIAENVGQDWDSIIAKARRILIDKLSKTLGVDIEPLIEVELVEEPRWFEARTSSWHGSLYGTAGNSRFSAFLRQANRSKAYEGLYFTGGSVHPGAGIPMCMASAKITAEIINNTEA